MARISTYPVDTDVKGGDILVGTDVNSLRAGATKNFTVDSLSEYVKEKVAVAGQMRYRYVAQPLFGSGNFSLPGGGTSPKTFSSINRLVLSKKDRTPQEVVSFMQYLINSDIYIGKQNSISTFGHYKVTGFAVNLTNPDYYNLDLTFLGGAGALILDDFFEIINFVKASSSGDLHFAFNQETPAISWTVIHNFGKFPAVSVVNTNNEEVFAQVDYVDKNTLTITFADPQAGKAYIN